MLRCSLRAMFAIALVAPLSACGDDQPGSADAGADAAAGGPRWIELAPIATGAVQETAVVALEGRVYVLGGIHDQRGTVADLLRYDPAADAWDQVAPLPAALHHVNAAVHGGRLYALGGLRADFSAVGQSWVYEPGADRWSELQPMPAGSERGAAAVGAVGDRIVVAGGQDGSVASAAVSAYLPASDSWEALPPLPAPRNHLVGAALGDHVYVIGGRERGIADVDDRVYALASGADAWQERAPMPTARGGAAAGVVGGEIVVVGGEGNAAATTGVFPQAEAYDPAADSWRALPDMSAPRHGMGAAGVGDRLYVPGGATVQAFGATDLHQALAL